MALTDYIPAEVLAKEGYVKKNDYEQIFALIPAEEFAKRGYYHNERVADIEISITEAAKIAGVNPKTLKSYAPFGYIKINFNGKLSLASALNYDKEKVKDHYHRQKMSKNYARRS